MEKFKVDDLVRVKPKQDIAPSLHFAVGPILRINPCAHYPYIISIKGREYMFSEDELEKI